MSTVGPYTIDYAYTNIGLLTAVRLDLYFALAPYSNLRARFYMT